MKIVVCIKPVPDTAAEIGLLDGRTPDLEHIPFIINPYDEFAVEAAVQLIEADGNGEIVLVSAVKAAHRGVLQEAMATGAHRAILVETGQDLLDSRATARALASAVTKDGRPDLILAGKSSVDTEGCQTPYRLAACLDYPVISEVSHLAVEGKKVIAHQETGTNEKEVIQVDLPCVIGVTKGINHPRHPKLPDIIKTRKKEIRHLSVDETGMAPGITMTALEPPPERAGVRMLEGTVSEQADELIRCLTKEKKVLS